MLFDDAVRFRGLPEDGYHVFSIRDRAERRRAIIDTFHPALEALGEDLVARLDRPEKHLHSHLPRLDWPKGYQPFCTWLALSRHTQGYQDGPQLNVGVHRDHVAVRLGWDTNADAFGRFEFLCLYGGAGRELTSAARETDLQFRVYGAVPWPEGSELVFESDCDIRSSFAILGQRGVWWEVGRRYEVAEKRELLGSPEFEREVLEVFRALLPVHDRVVGEDRE